MKPQRKTAPKLSEYTPEVQELCRIGMRLHGRRWRGPGAWMGQFCKDLAFTPGRFRQIMLAGRVPPRVMNVARALLAAHEAQRIASERAEGHGKKTKRSPQSEAEPS